MQLAALCLGVLVPTLVFVGVLFWQFAGSERSRVEEEARALSRGLAVALDREVNGVLTTLQALATSPSLQTRDLAAFYGQVSEIRRLQGIHISLRHVDGYTVLTTRAPFGASVAVPPLLAETDREVIRTGAAMVSNIFTSTTSSRPVFQIVAPPVLVAGTPTYMLGASVDPDYLTDMLRKERLPPGWLGAIIDRDGIFVARTERHDEFVGKRASAAFRGRAVGEVGSYYGPNATGEMVLAGYARSGLTGWTAAASLRVAAVDAPLRKSLLALIALGLCLAVLAIGLALVLGSRVDRAMQRLSDAAEDIGHGRQVLPLATPLAEVNRVGLALMASARRVRDRERERDDAEATLRDREERLRLVIEGAKDHAIFTTDRAGAITSWSAGAAAIFGWSAEEILGKPASVLFTPEDRAEHTDARELATAIREGSSPDERWHQRRDGSRVYMNGSVHRLPIDAQGRDQGFIKVARDETERRRADQALRELNETLETQVAERTRERDQVWRYSRDLQVIIDAEGVFRAVSPAVTAILGWTPDDMVGRTVFDFVLPEDAEPTSGALAQASRQALPAFENRYRHQDGGYRVLSWVAAPEHGLVYASGRDVTAQKQQEEALRQAGEQLRQAQKMEAVGQLTGGIAHDFNNLLAGIAGSLELMQTRMSQGRLGELDRYMVAAQGAAKRAAALTHRLLAFSRRQTLDPKPTDVNRLVVGMEELIRRTVGPAVAVEVVGAAGLWPTLIDPGQLENALLNLCINARDAMPDGGRITVETANKWLDERSARERDLEPGQYISLCVTDTGTGMSPAVIAKAFDPFFTTKPIGQGTGLGLSMIHGFARQSGGQVRIYSEVGRGTTMCLYLPRHYGAADVAEAVPDLAAAPRAERGETVLVVDDEAIVRMLITEVLAELGYSAIEAADGAAGLKVLRSDARIDLLITDVGLPGGMNGRQMADAARVTRPGLKILFITGYAENALVGNGHLEPGMQVLTKPFPMEGLAARISEIIGG